jgi:hypothetical protein
VEQPLSQVAFLRAAQRIQGVEAKEIGKFGLSFREYVRNEHLVNLLCEESLGLVFMLKHEEEARVSFVEWGEPLVILKLVELPSFCLINVLFLGIVIKDRS